MARNKVKENKIICEFMDWDHLKETDLYNSWHYIMLVIDKIESTSVKQVEDVGVYSILEREVTLSFQVCIDGAQCEIDKFPSPQFYGCADDFLKLHDCRTTDKRKSVWLAILAFINWYNTVK